MKKIKNLFLLAVITALALSGCKKYEDGPSFTLNSAKARMVNDWKLDKVYSLDGTIDETSFYSVYLNWELNFSKDYSMTENLLGFTTTGTWSFSDDRDTLKVLYSDNTSLNTYILKLESNDLWVKYSQLDVQLHFVSK